ncbi:unnamed protein product (macronuclear) [Paramecium tetraurelia]|uniref:Uncharacterized protein n=1 Tax=Paramecium tetraurelia TaxID=5888 RepID=A0E9B8_PARTE|nr:uncharacterized protein GSPATT00024616001 [Paramecium tetraurelia]CAK91885.1 unnamed protein product [Paramecium tetraurelia]|eukprot:XP_001459282.1 hypothetical protein (macronuclear) [Paramecium tetraurelia strain d4-2]
MDSTCNFCEYQYVQKTLNQDFAVIIKKALYEKYSSSQNYTYIRIINDLIFARRSRITNTFKDYLFWDYHDEYMENYFRSPNDLLYDTIKSNVLVVTQNRRAVPKICAPHISYSYCQNHGQLLQSQNSIISKILQCQFHQRFKNTAEQSYQKVTVSHIMLRLQQYSSQGSIFYIKNQLNDIVTNSSLSFQTINKYFIPNCSKQEVGVQLRVIYQKFCDRRQEIKKQKQNKRSQAHSIDKETQTQGFQFIPIIYHKDKQFLQKIIKQQKEKESTKIQFQKLNKQNKASRYRNSVEINNNRYGSASKISQQSTARVYESYASSRYNSTTTQQKLIRSQRTKSQTQDSNNITKALESQFNNQVDVRQTLKKFDSGTKQKKVK